MAIFAIGDIHGCNRTFRLLLNQLNAKPSDTIVLVGDYIDRGPDSKGVFDTIFSLQSAGFDIRCIRGNHEEILLEDVGFKSLPGFTSPILKQTLISFNVQRSADIPKKYLDFINTLPYYLEIEGCIFTHGGLDFSFPDPFSRPKKMAWARYWYDDIDYQWLGDRVVIHGHTPTPLQGAKNQIKDIKDQKGQVLNLDTGCVYKDQADLGVLTAVNLETMDLIVAKNIDM